MVFTTYSPTTHRERNKGEIQRTYFIYLNSKTLSHMVLWHTHTLEWTVNTSWADQTWTEWTQETFKYLKWARTFMQTVIILQIIVIIIIIVVNFHLRLIRRLPTHLFLNKISSCPTTFVSRINSHIFNMSSCKHVASSSLRESRWPFRGAKTIIGRRLACDPLKGHPLPDYPPAQHTHTPALHPTQTHTSCGSSVQSLETYCSLPISSTIAFARESN